MGHVPGEEPLGHVRFSLTPDPLFPPGPDLGPPQPGGPCVDKSPFPTPRTPLVRIPRPGPADTLALRAPRPCWVRVGDKGLFPRTAV